MQKENFQSKSSLADGSEMANSDRGSWTLGQVDGQ